MLPQKHGEIKEVKKEVKVEVDIKYPPTRLIDLICSRAKEQNEEALHELVRAGASIDTFNGIETAAQRLAAEEKVDRKALELLIGKFYVNLNNVVMGAAKRGHIDLVESLIFRGASIAAALFGAAEAGNEALLNYLFEKKPSQNYETAFGGAAFGHQEALFQKLVGSYDLLTNLDAAAFGAAKSKNLALLDRLLEIKGPEDKKALALMPALLGAAQRGEKDFVNQLLAKDDKSINLHLTIAAQGAAKAGHIALVLNLISRGASIEGAIIGAAIGGHFFLVQKLLSYPGGNINDAFIGAIIGRQIHLIQKWAPLCQSDQWPNIIKILIKEEYIDTEAKALRFLASFTDPNVRTLIAKKIQKSFATVWMMKTTSEDQKFFTRGSPFDIASLHTQANSSALLMSTFSGGLDKRIALQDPTIFGLLVMSRLERYLPRHLYFIVITYLSTSLATTEEITELYQDALLPITKRDIQSDLENYKSQYWNYGSLFYSTPLEKACDDARSLKILHKALIDELGDRNVKDCQPLQRLLHAHARAFVFKKKPTSDVDDKDKHYKQRFK